MMIDAHQHFWKLDLPFDYAWLQEPQHQPICQDRTPEHLLPMLQKAGVSGTVLVQTQHLLEENRWALTLAEQHAFILGVVGWVDLASPDCEQQLLEFLPHPKFCGVRHITQAEPDEDFIVRPEIVRGLRTLQKHNVPFDLLFYVQHLKHASTLGQQLPDLPMVIDHLSKPQIRDRRIRDWRRDLKNAARSPNICCKLSGMITEADWKCWSVADLQPYVETALEAFGPERCMFGSDWPVCELAGTYEQVVESITELLDSLSESEKHQVFAGTARRFYRLAEA